MRADKPVSPGFLFAALPGTTTDGARFVGEAIRRGASAIVAGRDADVPDIVPVLRAADPRRALALMAAKFHPRQPPHLVAVTGTSGKTSVADFTRQIFALTGHAAEEKPEASDGELPQSRRAARSRA